MLDAALPPSEKMKRTVGLVLLILGTLLGFAGMVGLVLYEGMANNSCGALCMGAGIALPMGLVYLVFPRILDRYDPEPWPILIGCFLWGALGTVGYAGWINTLASAVALEASDGDVGTATIVGAVISAPISEEFFKGLGIAGVFFFVKRDFDGIVDGIIYACFIAVGFAATENVLYYGRGIAMGSDPAQFLFALRGVATPYLHPLFTVMTGIGFGLARERAGAWKFLGPVGGYRLAVAMHAMWNGAATFNDAMGYGVPGLACMIVILLVYFIGFLVVVIKLVRRRGRIIRENLLDEVALGTITQQELDVVASALGLFDARQRYGPTGAMFVRAIARLALSKWHTTRANLNRSQTLSMSFIGPLRRQIAELRAQLRPR